MKYIKHILFISLFIINLTSSGQELVTDRPDQTESPVAVPGGSLQIESGVLFEFLSTEKSSERIIAAPTCLFRYGFIKGLELRVTSQFESYKNKSFDKEANGISDMEAGLKVEILAKEEINTKIAFLTHVYIPTGSEELTLNRYGSINKLALSHDINDNISIGYNIGYDYFEGNENALTYSLALGVGVGEKAGLFIESYGEFADMKDHLANFDAGFTYLLKENFQIDMSFGTGINHTMNFLSFGFSWRIDKD